MSTGDATCICKIRWQMTAACAAMDGASHQQRGDIYAQKQQKRTREPHDPRAKVSARGVFGKGMPHVFSFSTEYANLSIAFPAKLQHNLSFSRACLSTALLANLKATLSICCSFCRHDHVRSDRRLANRLLLAFEFGLRLLLLAPLS